MAVCLAKQSVETQPKSSAIIVYRTTLNKEE
jgi:hypothetical protein